MNRGKRCVEKGRGAARRLLPILATLTLVAAGLSPGARAANGSDAEGGGVLQDGVLTMAEAFGNALRANPAYHDVLLQRLDLEARRQGALGLESPEVSYMREGIADGLEAPGEERWTLTQELPSLPSVWKRRSGFSSRLEAADHQATASRRELRSRVKMAYADVVYQERILRLRRNQLALASKANEAVTLRLEMGEAARREQLQTRLNELAARNDLQEAQAAFDRSRYQLFALIGLDPEEQEYGVEFPDTLAFNPVNLDQEESLEELARQPRYLAATALSEAAEKDLAAESWSLFPALSVSIYKQNYEGAGFDNHGFEIGARLPLWFLPGHGGRVGQARAEVARSHWRQTAELLDMKREIEQAWHGYDASLAVLQNLTGEALDQSGELLNLALEGYNAGEAGLMELIAAQRTNLESRLRYQRALHDFNLRLIILENYLPGEIVMPVDSEDPANRGEY